MTVSSLNTEPQVGCSRWCFCCRTEQMLQNLVWLEVLFFGLLLLATISMSLTCKGSLFFSGTWNAWVLFYFTLFYFNFTLTCSAIYSMLFYHFSNELIWVGLWGYWATYVIIFSKNVCRNCKIHCFTSFKIFYSSSHFLELLRIKKWYLTVST